MQQFTVPQFIDVEDKIIGPITTRQFIIMLSDFILIALCYKIFDFEMFVVIGLLLLCLGGVFAFLKINGRPFHYFILNFIETLKRPPLRVWSNWNSDPLWVNTGIETKPQDKIQSEPHRTFPKSRLAQLSLIVDTHGAYRDEEAGEEISSIK
ncbi:MAG: PrgI family protein [Patescibacteria group bacterium]|jgi:hypothetical protein